MKIARWIGVCLVFMICTEAFGGTDCLEYEPTSVKVTGTMKRQVFPGPPNFASIAQGDAKEICWILYLDKPICVQGREYDEFNGPKSNLKKLQLVVNPKDYKTHKGLVNKKVSVTGTLFGAHTGHHHTDVLLNVIDMKLLQF